MIGFAGISIAMFGVVVMANDTTQAIVGKPIAGVTDGRYAVGRISSQLQTLVDVGGVDAGALDGGGDHRGDEAGDDGEPGDPTAERRIVTVGFADDDHTQVLDGLAPGEHVVVKGQRSLKHGTALKILESDASGAQD